MTAFLAKLFIKNRNDFSSPATRHAYGIMCSILGICLNVLLAAGKFAAGLISGSIAVTADAFNNLTDAGSSIVTLLGFHLAGQKPDNEHPFGHGRIEYISGLIISFLIVIVGFELGKTSVEKIFSGEKADFSIVSVIVLCASLAVKLYMAYYNRNIGEKINSAAMKAVMLDSFSDCIATATVLVCTVLGNYLPFTLDGYCGVAVGAFILVSGIRSAVETISPLLGQPPTKEYIDSIESIVMSHGGVSGMHDLIVHDYGPGRVMISLHAEVPADADLLETHDMIDNIERDLSGRLNCSAVIHMDPIETNDGTTTEMRERVAALVKIIDPSVTIHDFRIVKGPTHTNIIFDIVVPYNVNKTEQEIKREIEIMVKSLDSSYYAVVNVDKSYV